MTKMKKNIFIVLTLLIVTISMHAKGTLVSTELVKDTHSPINTSSLPNGNYFFILLIEKYKSILNLSLGPLIGTPLYVDNCLA